MTAKVRILTSLFRRVNAVETLYASWPAFLYVNATWAGYLLEPLLRFQSSNVYTKDFAAPDLGVQYACLPTHSLAYAYRSQALRIPPLLATSRPAPHSRSKPVGTCSSWPSRRLRCPVMVLCLANMYVEDSLAAADQS